MEPIRVLIVDDHPVVREGLRTMLSADQSIEIVDEACDGIEAVAKVAEKCPDVVLMDIRMPNLDGIEATRRIKDKCPATSVIVLTIYDNDAYVIDAVRAGASGYLLKDTPHELLLRTIQAVSSGTTLIKTNLLHEAISSLTDPKKTHHEPGASTLEGLTKLTPREQEVLNLVAVGHTNKEIGQKLGIAEDTVKKHMQNIIAKLDASGRTDAAIKAQRTGIIE